MVVGDEKQSIYGFQGADPRKTKTVEGTAGATILGMTARTKAPSTRPLEAVQAMITRKMTPRVLTSRTIAEKVNQLKNSRIFYEKDKKSEEEV